MGLLSSANHDNMNEICEAGCLCPLQTLSLIMGRLSEDELEIPLQGYTTYRGFILQWFRRIIFLCPLCIRLYLLDESCSLCS